jgi:hypothetical protein
MLVSYGDAKAGKCPCGKPWLAGIHFTYQYNRIYGPGYTQPANPDYPEYALIAYGECILD